MDLLPPSSGWRVSETIPKGPLPIPPLAGNPSNLPRFGLSDNPPRSGISRASSIAIKTPSDAMVRTYTRSSSRPKGLI